MAFISKGNMDEIDKKILNMLQNEFPLVPCPFQVVADRLGIPEEDVLERVKKLKDNGIIRRIGAVFDPCLLYTSPSPRDRQKSRMPSSA